MDRSERSKRKKDRQGRLPGGPPANTAVTQPFAPPPILPPPDSSEWEPIVARAPRPAASKPHGLRDARQATLDTMPTSRQREPPAQMAAHPSEGTRRRVRFASPGPDGRIVRVCDRGECIMCLPLTDWTTELDIAHYHAKYDHDWYLKRARDALQPPRADGRTVWVCGPDECIMCVPLRNNMSDRDIARYHRAHKHDFYLEGPQEPPDESDSDNDDESDASSSEASPPPSSPVHVSHGSRTAQAGSKHGSEHAALPTASRPSSLSRPHGATQLATSRSTGATEVAGTAPRGILRRTNSRSVPSCNACRASRPPVAYTERRAELYGIATAIGTSAWEQHPNFHTCPFLPSALAHLALPEDEEHDLVRVLETTGEQDIYSALCGLGYCVLHVSEILVAVCRDFELGYGVIPLQ